MFRKIILTLMALMASVCKADCFDKAAHDYSLDPDLLRAIAWTESQYRIAAIGNNPESGYGMGLMQIDSQNIAHLKQFGITPQMLLSDPCMNIYTGAYFLAIAFKRWGATWRAVGAYNAGFSPAPQQEHRRKLYARKVFEAYTSIHQKASSFKTSQ